MIVNNLHFIESYIIDNKTHMFYLYIQQSFLKYKINLIFF
jgi:hypothetical protein